MCTFLIAKQGKLFVNRLSQLLEQKGHQVLATTAYLPAQPISRVPQPVKWNGGIR
ncbi:MAG: hypothetical protein LH606_10820 [Cytophagaceae bacterium]|nr:hypothetical protein [Cytophagaceae bacterium]